MINWTKYFDKIVCLNYNKMSYRKLLLEYELKRVGILDSGIFLWYINFREFYEHTYKYILSRYDIDLAFRQLNLFSCTKGHLDIMRKVYYLGCNRVLILEDDARFLKDLNKLEEILLNIPDDNLWLIILFNYFTPDTTTFFFNTIKNKNNKINNFYFKSHTLHLYSASTYCLNRKALDRMITAYDTSCLTQSDTFWNFGEKYYPILTKRLLSLPALSVQLTFSNSQNVVNFGYNKAAPSNWYRNIGLNFDDYMMRKDGSPYNCGDWIEE